MADRTHFDIDLKAPEGFNRARLPRVLGEFDFRVRLLCKDGEVDQVVLVPEYNLVVETNGPGAARLTLQIRKDAI